MIPAADARENPLPGWISICRVRRESRGRAPSSSRERQFRFVCVRCGSVGGVRPSTRAALVGAIEHVRVEHCAPYQRVSRWLAGRWTWERPG